MSQNVTLDLRALRILLLGKWHSLVEFGYQIVAVILLGLQKTYTLGYKDTRGGTEVGLLVHRQLP